jgi:hypothetical protein
LKTVRVKRTFSIFTQLYFQLLARDPVDALEPMLLDTVDLPFWDGKSAPYPSVRLRMDFRVPEIVGTFLFHGHILEHEDDRNDGLQSKFCGVPKIRQFATRL